METSTSDGRSSSEHTRHTRSSPFSNFCIDTSLSYRDSFFFIPVNTNLYKLDIFDNFLISYDENKNSIVRKEQEFCLTLYLWIHPRVCVRVCVRTCVCRKERVVFFYNTTSYYVCPFLVRLKSVL